MKNSKLKRFKTLRIWIPKGRKLIINNENDKKLYLLNLHFIKEKYKKKKKCIDQDHHYQKQKLIKAVLKLLLELQLSLSSIKCQL